MIVNHKTKLVPIAIPPCNIATVRLEVDNQALRFDTLEDLRRTIRALEDMYVQCLSTESKRSVPLTDDEFCKTFIRLYDTLGPSPELIDIAREKRKKLESAAEKVDSHTRETVYSILEAMDANTKNSN